MKNKKFVYLNILDGFGLGKKEPGNAIYEAIKQGKAPYFKELFEKNFFLKIIKIAIRDNTMYNKQCP